MCSLVSVIAAAKVFWPQRYQRDIRKEEWQRKQESAEIKLQTRSKQTDTASMWQPLAMSSVKLAMTMHCSSY
jgi:L-lactate permease